MTCCGRCRLSFAYNIACLSIAVWSSQDVASGVPMAQSTEQLQVLLKDMGFEQTTPREVAQHQQETAFREAGFSGPGGSMHGELRSGGSGDMRASEDGRQSLDPMAGAPMVPAASAQRPQVVAAPSTVSLEGGSVQGLTPIGAPSAAETAPDVLPSGSLQQALPPPGHLRTSPVADAPVQHAGLRVATTPGSPAVQPDLLAAAQDSASQAVAQQQQQHRHVQPHQPQQQQQQSSWRRWSESSVRDTTRQAAQRSLPLPMASPFHVRHHLIWPQSQS